MDRLRWLGLPVCSAEAAGGVSEQELNSRSGSSLLHKLKMVLALLIIRKLAVSRTADMPIFEKFEEAEASMA